MNIRQRSAARVPARFIPAALVASLVAAASAQTSMSFPQGGAGLPAAWTAGLGSAKNSDAELRRSRDWIQKQKEMERELRKIRFEYFRRTRDDRLRQIGIAELSKFTSPEAYPLLLEIFAREDMEVRTAILAMLHDQQTPEADATLAWSAILDRSPEFRAAAASRLSMRIAEQGGEAPPVVERVIGGAIQLRDEATIDIASRLADNLNIVGVIPYLIAGQAGPVGGGGGNPNFRGDGDLAYILIGRQVAYVADLTPVVGNSAVAFDPTLAVVTEGVLLRVHDATVFTYSPVANTSLTSLASRFAGRDLSSFGYDQRAWWDWYQKELHPVLVERRAQRSAALLDAPLP